MPWLMATLEILTTRVIAYAYKYADTIALKAGVRNVSWPGAYDVEPKDKHHHNQKSPRGLSFEGQTYRKKIEKSLAYAS
jgi:hypothetical protein